jgi:WD40 repeat protein
MPEPQPRKAPFDGKDLQLLAPSPDGKLVAICEQNHLLKQNTLRICNTSTGEDSQRLQTPGYQAYYSADGKLFASSDRRTIVLRNAQTGEQIRSFDAGNRLSSFMNFALAPNGRVVAALHRGPGISIRLWDAATGKEMQSLQMSDPTIRAVTFSADSKILAVAGQLWLRTWDVSSGKMLWEHHEYHNQFFSIAFSPDSKTLAAGGGVEVRRYDAATGQERPPVRDGERITGLGLLGDGRTVVSVAPEKPLRLWRLPNAEEILPAPGQKPPVVPIVDDVSPDGKWMASGGHADGAVRIWDLASGKEIRRLPHVKSPACSFSPDGRWLQTHDYVQDPISHKFEHELRFWDARTGKMVNELRGKQASVARFSPDSRLYATQGSRSICYVATVPEASVVQTIATPNGPWRFYFSADSRLLAGASLREVTPHLWEVASGKEVAILFGKPKGSRDRGWPGITEVRFSPEGRKLIAGDSDGNLFCWDVEGRLLRQWKGDDFAVNCLSFTPDEKILVTGGNTTGLVWNMDEVLPPQERRTTTLMDKDMQTLWSDLKAEDATQAWRAVWKLAAAPDQAIPFLRERLRPAREPDKTNAEKIVKLIDELDNDIFAVREKASRELAELGKEAEPALRKALAGNSSAESKRRIDDLLRKMPETPPSCEHLFPGNLLTSHGHWGNPRLVYVAPHRSR